MKPDLKQKADRLVAEAEAHRDRLITKAVADRKISADRADDYKRLYNANPEIIGRLLTAPVAEGGLVAGINLGGNAFPEGQSMDYPAEWLPEVQGKRLHGGVAFEDDAAAVDSAAGATPPRRHASAAPAGRDRITLEP